MINLRDLASPCSFKKSIILAMPSMGEHSVSARIGKKKRICKETLFNKLVVHGTRVGDDESLLCKTFLLLLLRPQFYQLFRYLW